MCLERATIAVGQGASENEKFAAKPTRLNMKLFPVFGIILIEKNKRLFNKEAAQIFASGVSDHCRMARRE